MTQEYDKAAGQLASEIVDSVNYNEFVNPIAGPYKEDCTNEEDLAYWNDFNTIGTILVLKAADSMSSEGLMGLMTTYLKTSQEIEDEPMSDEEVDKFLKRFKDFVEYVNHAY